MKVITKVILIPTKLRHIAFNLPPAAILAHFAGVMEAVAELFSDPVTPAAAWFGPKLVVGIARPEDMQTVLMSNNCLQKGYMYGFMHNKTGIFTSDGMCARYDF